MTPLELVREHVAGAHALTALGCPVCADLPRQEREGLTRCDWRGGRMACVALIGHNGPHEVESC